MSDLLRHTSGLTYGVFGKSAIKSRYLAASTHLWPDTGGLEALGYGFGLGFAVCRGKGGAWPSSTGDLYWGGYAGTYCWIAPRKKLLVVYMMQNVS